MDDSLYISVIIPTLGRAEYLSRTVSDLHSQSYRNAEIIVVDQGNGEDIDLTAPSGLPVRYIRDTGRGLNRSRNIGARAARGDILVFVDDDVELAGPDFILGHARAYLDLSIGGVCGRTIELREEMRRAARSRSIPYVSPIICVPLGDASLEIQGFVNTVKGGNMSFRSEIVRAIGGFDEKFGHPCIYEETDFALKVCRRGHRILFCPEAALYHIGAPSGGMRVHDRNADRRFVAYRDRVLLFANNRPMWQFPLFFLGNLLLALRPLAAFKGREATRSCAGLFAGIRLHILPGRSTRLGAEGSAR